MMPHRPQHGLYPRPLHACTLTLTVMRSLSRPPASCEQLLRDFVSPAAQQVGISEPATHRRVPMQRRICLIDTGKQGHRLAGKTYRKARPSAQYRTFYHWNPRLTNDNYLHATHWYCPKLLLRSWSIPSDIMLDLAVRLLAITACLFGIAVCACISEEVLRSHNQDKTLDPEKAMESSELKPRFVAPLGHQLSNLIMAATKSVNLIVNQAIPAGPSKQAIRLQQGFGHLHLHWATSTSQTHPAVA